jgi:hypothetical protein
VEIVLALWLLARRGVWVYVTPDYRKAIVCAVDPKTETTS